MSTIEAKHHARLTQLKMQGYPLKECAAIVGVPYKRNVLIGVTCRMEKAWKKDERDLEICKALDGDADPLVLAKTYDVTPALVLGLQKELEMLDAV